MKKLATTIAIGLAIAASSSGCTMFDGLEASLGTAPGSPGGPLTVPIGTKCVSAETCGGGRCVEGGCIPGAPCTDDAQCGRARCSGGGCYPAVALDGEKDGDETDVDCGGAVAPRCPNGKACATGTDCTTRACTQGVCAPPGPTDGARNADETDIDCGGTAAPACKAGADCGLPRDCDTLVCGADKKCAAPSPTDHVKNGTETDVDCGGTSAPKCALDKACVTNDDCELLACTAQKCVVPTATDGSRNGGETDVDCGGAGVSAGLTSYQAPRCTFDKTCGAGSDCLTGACPPGGGKCSLASCATGEAAGIVTCGAKETGEAGEAHDSCCKSLVLPTRTTRRLDKYEITSGRFRTFLGKAGPNVRAWVSTFVATNPTSQLAQMLTSFPVLGGLYPAADRASNLNLTAHMGLDIDNYDGIRGCYNGAGTYSANTYWQDTAHLADYGIPARPLARTVSDEKPLNCAMPIMFAAFCAWDGGEMATMADYLDVWPAGTAYPSATTCPDAKPCVSHNWCNGPPNNGGFTCQNPALSVAGEAGVFYEYPRNTDRSKDNEPLIAAPGRFQTDQSIRTSGGEAWFDLFANLGEYTGDFSVNAAAGQLTTFCDLSAGPLAGQPTCTRVGHPGQTGTQYSNIPQVGLLGNTWEGHHYSTAALPGPVQSGLPATFQYGKFGARCVRPAATY